MPYLLAIIFLGCVLADSPRLFESTCALQVWAIDLSKAGSANESPTLLGTTPTPDGKGVSIPTHATWYVKPVKRIDDVALGMLAAELLEQKVPGLNLSNCLITDAALAHLKGLSALTTLDLEDTQVTDAGIEVLRSARPGLDIQH